MDTKNFTSVDSWLTSKLGVIIATCALAIAVTTVGLARSSAGAANAAPDGGNPMVLGMAFDGHQVSNLDNTIKYYEQIGRASCRERVSNCV